MSIRSAIDRIDYNIKDSLAAVSEQGVTVPSDANSDNLPSLIRSISRGVTLPELTNPAFPADILSGKEAIDGTGQVITGTYTVEDLEAVITELETKVATLNAELEGKASGGSGSGSTSVATCTVTLSLSSEATLWAYGYTYVSDDGSIAPAWVSEGSGFTDTEIVLENVVCGSFIYALVDALTLDTELSGGVTLIDEESLEAFKAPTTSGAIATIHFFNNPYQ